MSEDSPRVQVGKLSRELLRLRGFPFLVIDAPTDERTVQAVRDAVSGLSGELGVVLRSPGGCACCSYAIARELKRRFDRVSVFVPLAAKSAAVLIALAADDLVLGNLGELGPLDAQFSDKQRADFPVDRSRLAVFRALDHLRQHAIGTFDQMVRQLVKGSGMRADDVFRNGSEFAARVCGPLYAQIDPLVLGESLRSMEVGTEYAGRILRRYRAEVWAQDGPRIVERLVHGYPDHGFVIDREELMELAIPVRAPTAEEAPLIDAMTAALRARTDDEALIELVTAGEPEKANEETAVQLEHAA